jgi:uncharacterized membrane protein
MIRGLIRTTLAAMAGGWVIDRWLAARATGQAPDLIHSVTEIDAPIEDVWLVIADVAGQPRWMRDMKAVRVLSPGPIAVGTRAEADIRILGMRARDPITITAFEPPRRFAISHDGIFSGKGEIELVAGADGGTTIVRWDETIVPPYLPYLGVLLLGPILQAVFQADLDRLRELVESETARA